LPFAASLYYQSFEGLSSAKIPVVLIHGAGGNHLSWPSEIRRLHGYRVVALDLPGHGKSEGIGLQSIDAYAQAVISWLEAINLNKAFFIGHSMGSAIALTLAHHYSEQVMGLGLIGSSTKFPVNPELIEDTGNASTYIHAVETIIQWSFSEQTEIIIKKLTQKRLVETRYTVLHGDFLACDGFDCSSWIETIDKPTLVVSGLEDKMTPVRWGRFLASKIKGARVEILEGAGHMVVLEKPQAVAQLLTGFLDGLANEYLIG
jgi:pimeloyl-ACP methyl ester carboxylesterase